MNSAKRAAIIRARLRARNLTTPQSDLPPSRYKWWIAKEGGRPFSVYLPRKNGPKKIAVWVQTPDPEPPILKVRLPQSALVPLAQRWFEEWQAKQLRAQHKMCANHSSK